MDGIEQCKDCETDLEKLVNSYLVEKFGSKYGNGSAKQAFIDGYKIALGINTVIECKPKKAKQKKSRMDCLARKVEREKYL